MKSHLLSIGGIEFRFTPSVSWPDLEYLNCYRSFLNEPTELVADADIISVALKSGMPELRSDSNSPVRTGESIRWFRAGSADVVEKILPKYSPAPLWRIIIHSAGSTAEIYFSEKYLEVEQLDDAGLPVGAPRYPLDQNLIMHFLASRHGALIHSAGIRLNNRGFMCSGVSTAGKTTISRLLADHGQFEILTDDRVILRLVDNGVCMHGTPWTGEGQYASSGRAPLSALFFLKKDTEVRAKELSVQETVARLMPVSSVPWFSEPLMTATLKTLEAVAETIPAYDLHFTKTDDTAAFIADMLNSF